MIRTGVIDDHEAIRLGVAAALEHHARDRVVIVAGAGSVDDFLDVGADADVVLLDLQLADASDPLENTERLIEAGYRVLVYSVADNARLLRRALAGGADGVCRKAEPIAQTLASIEAVAAGHMVLSQEILALIEGDSGYVSANLGAREKEVLALYAGGMEVPEVARRLAIAENSVKEYLKRIRAKYCSVSRPATSKLDLFRRAIEDGIVPPVEPRL